MAMIGRNAAVAEVGKKRHELEGVIGFAAWLGVHASLLDTNQARIEAFMEWAWTYFWQDPGLAGLDRTARPASTGIVMLPALRLTASS